MPIKNKAAYPANWKAISAAIRERDGNRCKWCGVPNGERGARDERDRWHSEARIASMNGTEGEMLFGEYPKIIKIVLTVAHIDRDTGNNSDENLAALCQRCHLRHDAQQHATNAARTRAEKKHAVLSEDGQLSF